MTLCTVAPTILLCPWNFSRQEYWSGLPFATPEDPPHPGTEPMYLTSPALAGGFFTDCTTREALLSSPVYSILLPQPELTVSMYSEAGRLGPGQEGVSPFAFQFMGSSVVKCWTSDNSWLLRVVHISSGFMDISFTWCPGYGDHENMWYHQGMKLFSVLSLFAWVWAWTPFVE